MVGSVSGDEGDLSSRRKGGDGDGGRGFSPWLRVSLCAQKEQSAHSIDINTLAVMLATLLLRTETERRPTQKSSCQGGTTHFHQYIRRELSSASFLANKSRRTRCVRAHLVISY